MTACLSCGRELPEGVRFCPGCGARVLDPAMPTSFAPSHFNTATYYSVGSSYVPPWKPPSEGSRVAGRRGLMFGIIAVLIVLLVGVSLESGVLGPGVGPGGLAVNSASDPFTGEQLYAAYASNQSRAAASYTNKTVYIQDNLSSAAVVDPSTGRYFSSVDSGAVLLYWGSQAPLSQLQPGSTVLARCSVAGVQQTAGSGNVLTLQNCSLISWQSQTAASTFTVSENHE